VNNKYSFILGLKKEKIGSKLKNKIKDYGQKRP
jgi:hypothetical protein